MSWHEYQAEYNRGFQDGLRNRGYDDRSVNTKGHLIDFRLTFREFAGAYAEGYCDGLAYRGQTCDLVTALQ